MILSIVEGALLLTGSIFILLAAVGILRMPDLFTRLQVTSKASVLGMTCILSAAALHFDETAVTARAFVIIAFVVLTMPVATHLLARAGYATNTPLSRETVVNELTGHYDPATHTLAWSEPRMRRFQLLPGAAVSMPENRALMGKCMRVGWLLRVVDVFTFMEDQSTAQLPMTATPPANGVGSSMFSHAILRCCSEMRA